MWRTSLSPFRNYSAICDSSGGRTGADTGPCGVIDPGHVPAPLRSRNRGVLVAAEHFTDQLCTAYTPIDCIQTCNISSFEGVAQAGLSCITIPEHPNIAIFLPQLYFVCILIRMLAYRGPIISSKLENPTTASQLLKSHSPEARLWAISIESCGLAEFKESDRKLSHLWFNGPCKSLIIQSISCAANGPDMSCENFSNDAGLILSDKS